MCVCVQSRCEDGTLTLQHHRRDDSAKVKYCFALSCDILQLPEAEHNNPKDAATLSPPILQVSVDSALRKLFKYFFHRSKRIRKVSYLSLHCAHKVAAGLLSSIWFKHMNLVALDMATRFSAL